MAPNRTIRDRAQERPDVAGYSNRNNTDDKQKYTGEELIAKVLETCSPTAYDSLPSPSNMLYTNELIYSQARDNKKIFIGWHKNGDNPAYPVWAFIQVPFRVVFMTQGSKFSGHTLSEHVTLEPPFIYAKRDITMADEFHTLESLIAYYLVTSGAWNLFCCGGKNEVVSLIGLQTSIRRIHRAVSAGMPAGGRDIVSSQEVGSPSGSVAAEDHIKSHEASGMQKAVATLHRRVKDEMANTAAERAKVKELEKMIEELKVQNDDLRGKSAYRAEKYGLLRDSLLEPEGISKAELKRREKLYDEVEKRFPLP
jgi:hypothetical protein